MNYVFYILLVETTEPLVSGKSVAFQLYTCITEFYIVKQTITLRYISIQIPIFTCQLQNSVL